MTSSLLRFAQYGLVAIGSAITDWATFIAMTSFGISHLPAQMTSRIAGGIFSFMVNKTWAFDREIARRFWTEGRRFMLLYGFSYVLSLALLYLTVDVLQAPLYFAKLFSDSTCFVINFLVMKMYVFHDRLGISGWLLRSFRSKAAPELDRCSLNSSKSEPR